MSAPRGKSAWGKAAAHSARAHEQRGLAQALATKLGQPDVPLRVLGLDPGSVRTGWGIVEPRRTGQQGIAAGVIRVRERDSLGKRLETIHRGVAEVIAEHKPHAIAVEDIFSARFARSALLLGHARGVAILAAAQAGFEIAAYPPALVKRAIAGRGRADKSQVALLVAALLGLRVIPPEDATDALAIALTHLNAMRALGGVSAKVR